MDTAHGDCTTGQDPARVWVHACKMNVHASVRPRFKITDTLVMPDPNRIPAKPAAAWARSVSAATVKTTERHCPRGGWQRRIGAQTTQSWRAQARAGRKAPPAGSRKPNSHVLARLG